MIYRKFIYFVQISSFYLNTTINQSKWCNITAYHAAIQHVKQLCTALEIHQRTLNCKATFNYELTKGNTPSMKSMPVSLTATQLITDSQTIIQLIFFSCYSTNHWQPNNQRINLLFSSSKNCPINKLSSNPASLLVLHLLTCCVVFGVWPSNAIIGKKLFAFGPYIPSVSVQKKTSAYIQKISNKADC